MIDIQESMNTVWAALEGYRALVIPEGRKDNDQSWNEICTAMATIQEDLGLDEIEGQP